MIGRRIILGACLLIAWAAAGVPTVASAASSSSQAKQVIEQFDQSRADLSHAIDRLRAGDRDGARKLVISAYLDHYEVVEPSLRAVDSDLTLSLEERFATVRSRITDGADVRSVADAVASVRDGLTMFETELDRPTSAAGAFAAASSFSIMFREGLELVLLLAALVGFLEASEKRHFRKPVFIGVGGAIVASIATFVLLQLVIGIAPLQRELIEAFTTLIAVVMLFVVSFWLLRRMEHRRWMEFVRARFWTAMASGSTLAIVGVGFVAAYREGFETVLFYQALLGFTTGMHMWVLAGLAAAVAALSVVGYLMLRLRRHIPVKAFLTTALTLVMVMSVMFLGNAVNQLQNLSFVPATSLLGEMPRLPVFWAQMTGIHPSVESLAAQGVLALMYVVGAAWVHVAARRGRMVTAIPAAPVTDMDIDPDPVNV